MSDKKKFYILIALEVTIIFIILFIIYLSGIVKYRVEFDMNGGTLVEGELVQKVTKGEVPTLPDVKRDGYKLTWSPSVGRITQDTTYKATWTFNVVTTDGLEFEVVEDSGYCYVSGIFEHHSGTVYIPSTFTDKFGKTYKVLGIQDEAFKNNLNITNLYIYSGLVSIGKSAFEGCKNLKTITFANSVKVIEDAAFKNCTKLTNVTLPNKLVSIGNEAFYNVSLITGIVVPKSVTKIGKEAFCSNTRKIVINCEAQSKGSQWDKNWASGYFDVVWSYKEGKDK